MPNLINPKEPLTVAEMYEMLAFANMYECNGRDKIQMDVGDAINILQRLLEHETSGFAMPKGMNT